MVVGPSGWAVAWTQAIAKCEERIMKASDSRLGFFDNVASLSEQVAPLLGYLSMLGPMPDAVSRPELSWQGS